MQLQIGVGRSLTYARAYISPLSTIIRIYVYIVDLKSWSKISVDLKCWSKMFVVKTVQEISFSSCSAWVFICLCLRDQLYCTEYVHICTTLMKASHAIFTICTYISMTSAPTANGAQFQCSWLEALHVAWAQKSSNVRSFFVSCGASISHALHHCVVKWCGHCTL